MKIVNFHLGAAVLNLPLDDVRPTSGVNPQQLINLVATRYKFTIRPQPNQISLKVPAGIPPALAAALVAAGAGTPGMSAQLQGQFVLQSGTASIEEKTIPIARIEITRDLSAIIMHTTTTDEADSIIEDLIPVLQTELGFRRIKESSWRTYSSEIVVEFDKDIGSAIAVIGQIQNIINPPIKSATRIEQNVKFERLGFAFDPAMLPVSAGQVPGFIIERRVGSTFSDNRFFCSAPLKTPDHISALEKIGAIFEAERQ